MLSCASGAALAQTPAPQPEASALQTLTIDDIVARLEDRLLDWGMFARAGEPIVASASAAPGAIILTIPVRYARTGFVQSDVRDAGSDRILIARGAPAFARATHSNAQISEASRAWCVVVTEGERTQRAEGRCLAPGLPGPPGGGLAFVRDGSPYAPRALSPWRPAASTPAPMRIVEDRAAAAAFPPMQIVYTFKRWSGEIAYFDRSVRIGDRIVELADANLPRARDGATVLSVAGGALRLAPGADRESASVEITEPLETESELRDEAAAIARLLTPGSSALGDSFAVSFATSDQARAEILDQAQVFNEMPDGLTYARHYPRRARQRPIEGRVLLACARRASGRLRCIVQSETPAGFDFGYGALSAMEYFRVRERLPDGRPLTGAALRIPIRFLSPQ